MTFKEESDMVRLFVKAYENEKKRHAELSAAYEELDREFKNYRNKVNKRS